MRKNPVNCAPHSHLLNQQRGLTCGGLRFCTALPRCPPSARTFQPYAIPAKLLWCSALEESPALPPIAGVLRSSRTLNEPQPNGRTHPCVHTRRTNPHQRIKFTRSIPTTSKGAPRRLKAVHRLKKGEADAKKKARGYSHLRAASRASASAINWRYRCRYHWRPHCRHQLKSRSPKKK
jgi:hypothetical protein